MCLLPFSFFIHEIKLIDTKHIYSCSKEKQENKDSKNKKKVSPLKEKEIVRYDNLS